MRQARHKIPRQTKKAVKTSIRNRHPRHRKIVSHPLSLFVILCLGLSLISWSVKAYSDSYTVNAEVPAAPLPSGAYITSPAGGQSFSSSPIDVIGTCPVDSYVELFNNDLLVGVSWCQNDSFLIQAGLNLGGNTLKAQDFNITNGPGPATPVVNVSLNSPLPPVPPNQVATLRSKAGTPPGAIISNSGLPLTLTAQYSFRSFTVKEGFNWQVNVRGGTAPYVIQIDWGDGLSNIMSPGSLPDFTIHHQYLKIGYYPIKIRAVDSAGNQSFLQLAAFVGITNVAGIYNSCGQNSASVTTYSNNCNGTMNLSSSWILTDWLWLAWSSYFAVTVMAASYLLGERGEYRRLLKRYPTLLK